MLPDQEVWEETTACDFREESVTSKDFASTRRHELARNTESRVNLKVTAEDRGGRRLQQGHADGPEAGARARGRGTHAPESREQGEEVEGPRSAGRPETGRGDPTPQCQEGGRGPRWVSGTQTA